VVVTVGGLYGHRHGEGVDGEYQLGDLFFEEILFSQQSASAALDFG